MGLILSIFYLLLGFVIGLFVYAQMLLPLIYGAPKSLFLFAKGKVRFMAIISQLITPIVWFVGLFIFGFIFERIYPPLNKFITSNPAFGFGSILSIGALVLNFLSSKGRQDMYNDYMETTYSRYRKD